MKTRLLTAAILLAACTGTAMAQTTQTPRVDKRQANQEQRIEKGKTSGQLNDKEAARLEKGQKKVGKMETAAKSDGKVTGKEKAALHHAQNKQSKRIAKQKHDGQTKAPQ